MRSFFALLFSMFIAHTAFAGKDFCTTLNSATKLILQKNTQSLGKQISDSSSFGTDYEFPAMLYGARYAYARVSEKNMIVRQYFENDSRDIVEPVFDFLLNELKFCGIDLKEDRFGGYTAEVNNLYYSLELFELEYNEATETTNYSVQLTISVKL